MAITDPEVIRFVNEEVRPIAETLRAVKIKSAAVVSRWFADGINSRCPNDSSALEDGREIEGVSRLKGSDINSLVAQLANISSQYNSDIIELPCVRPLSVS